MNIHENPFTAELGSLLILTVMFGIKHGLDADHLATIDGIARLNFSRNQRLSRCCGTWFSVGHGAVVLAMALGLFSVAEHWTIPAWFDVIGSIVSILFLLVLGSINLFAVINSDPESKIEPKGIKRFLLNSLPQASGPFSVALVGGLFALSYDTLSQAAFFAMTATALGGYSHVLILGCGFTFGMLVTDGINGLWISKLIARADQVAQLTSRIMAVLVSGLSILIALHGILRLLVPEVSEWSRGKEIFFGGGVVVVIFIVYMFAKEVSRRRSAAILE